MYATPRGTKTQADTGQYSLRARPLAPVPTARRWAGPAPVGFVQCRSAEEQRQ